MSILRITTALTGLTFSGFLCAALPSAEKAQFNYCRGLIAETTTSGTGQYIVGTYLYITVGPAYHRKSREFFDEDNWGTTSFQQNARSRAGCEDCLGDQEYPYDRLALSEHFWQEHQYTPFNEYCPNTQTFGTWVPGDYCEAIVKQHAGCVPI